MKLKELLDVVTDDYLIGITDSSGKFNFISYNTKDEAVKTYANNTSTTVDDIENLEVNAIYPCDRVYCEEEHAFGDVMPFFHIETQLCIEVKLEGLDTEPAYIRKNIRESSFA